MTTLLSILCFGLISITYSASVQPFTYSSLPIGSITPGGWLQSQLQIQAAGLTGHLSEFWHGVNQSSWILPGGGGDNQLEEFTPYWFVYIYLPSVSYIRSFSYLYPSIYKG